MFFKSKDNSQSLESIIAKCKVGDSKAQRELIKMFLGYAKTIVSRYLHIQEEQEEVINDGFLKIFTHIGKHDPSKSFKGWVRTIFVNTAIDYYHKYNKFNHVTDIEDVEITDLHYDVISKLSADEILHMVQQLSPVYKMVFTLYVIEGYNHREIAEMLHIKEGTSKSNLQDARRKLQSMIASKYPHLSQTYALKITKSHER
jgi:RNA polymerase sigma-70 factor (ECF subfamily)